MKKHVFKNTGNVLEKMQPSSYDSDFSQIVNIEQLKSKVLTI